MFRLTMMPIGTLLPMFLPLLLLVSCFQATGVTSDTLPRSEDDSGRRASDDCRSVSDVFAGQTFDEEPVIPTRKINGQNLEICNETVSGTCCTRSLEETLISLAVFHTQDVVANFSFDLKSHLASVANLYRDHLNELLSLSENNTRDVLTSTFKIPVAAANASVEKLFSDFAAYIEIQDEVNVRQSVSQFFDALFPLVFTFSQEDPDAVSDEYQECLINNGKDLRPPPFGEVARQLVQDVAKSLEVARALLDAFDLMAEAINITNHLGDEQYCSRAIARLLFCSRCDGHAEVQPCRNFCLNVMRGCMAHVAEVNNHWNLFVTAVEKLVYSLRGTHDFQDVLNSFYSKVYDSVMHYFDNSHKYHLKVISKCGPPLAGVTVEMTASVGKADSSRPTTAEPGRPLLEDFPTKIQKKISFNAILRNIASSKGFFNKLPDVVCDSEKYSSASDNSTCWNGTAVSKYSRSVPVAALTSQVAENPELQVPDALVPDVVKLIEKLNLMTKVLHKRVIPQPYSGLSNSDSEYNSGAEFSGSGGWYDGEFSASGSGSTTNDTSFSSGPHPSSKEIPEEEFKRTDTTDFVFDPKSTASSLQPAPYKTSNPETTALSSSTTTARTIVVKPSPPVGSHSTVASAVTFLPILAFTIQRICCA